MLNTILNLITLSIIMLSAIMINIITLIVFMPSIVTVSVTLLCHFAKRHSSQCHFGLCRGVLRVM
jgi:hypothetical protein